jgi:hypothetical protein
MHVVFHLVVVRKNGVRGVQFSGGQKDGSRRVINRDCREMREKSPLHCYKSLPCAWHCYAGRGLDLAFCLAQPSEFVVLTSVISAYIALN